MFSQSTLDAIRERTDLVEVISQYVPLKKTGSGYQGLCPFHQEKTPSFHVHPLKKIFHCFGCQKGGNVFSFLMEIEGLPFREVVTRLAEKEGIHLEETDPKQTKRKSEKALPPTEETKHREEVLKALAWASKYFHFLFLKSPNYQFARDYVKKRGLTQKSVEKFSLGVSPRGWTSLQSLMIKKGFTIETLLAAGLLTQREQQEKDQMQTRDRFRHRLMFPILDLAGAVIGFGARALGEEQPKYLNSPETIVFSKGKTLYGIAENQRGIRTRGQAILVEGYMDVVGLFEAGVDNAVAGMGTAFTEEQAKLLQKITRKVITIYDSDTAGTEAYRKSISLFLRMGIFAKDLSLPQGLDPDEFVLQFGASTLYELCQKAPRQVTKRLQEIAAKGHLSEEERIHVLTEFTPLLQATRNQPDRALLWDDLSLLLHVSIPTLDKISQTSSYSFSSPSLRSYSSKTSSPVRTSHTKTFPSKSKVDPIDEIFFKAAIADPTNFQKIEKEVWSSGIQTPLLREILEKLHCIEDSSAWEGFLFSLIDPASYPVLIEAPTEKEEKIQWLITQISSWVRELFFEKKETSTASHPAHLNQKEPENTLSQAFQTLLRRKKKWEIQNLVVQVKLSEKLGDTEKTTLLLEKLRLLRTTLLDFF